MNRDITHSSQIGQKGQKNYSRKFQIIYHIWPTTCFCVAHRVRLFFPLVKEEHKRKCENYM